MAILVSELEKLNELGEMKEGLNSYIIRFIEFYLDMHLNLFQALNLNRIAEPARIRTFLKITS